MCLLFDTALEKFLLSRTRYQIFSHTFTKIELSLRDRPHIYIYIYTHTQHIASIYIYISVSQHCEKVTSTNTTQRCGIFNARRDIRVNISLYIHRSHKDTSDMIHGTLSLLSFYVGHFTNHQVRCSSSLSEEFQHG